ncbi:hypothetical protein [Nocardia terpenica]|uniref:Uncharacterized protein n=1 Tax=Nocardia terpenica TaxID=455432 RepID=A0A6G9Z9M8_9NOCA|nr:hypothetical protein [Nocardia terpenica]QIS22101.1 hypothetical protein F6W96_30910 [Nocardia terpenica]
MLHADDELVQHINTDTVETGARQWRLTNLDASEIARSWHNQEAHVIDTTGLQPRQVAKPIAAQADQIHIAATDRHPAN